MSTTALVASLLIAATLRAEPGSGESPSEKLQAYRQAVGRLGAERTRLAAAYSKAPRSRERQQILREARAVLLKALDGELIPAWYGTPWEFYGTSERPGEGTIACGYFVSTVLRDAGMKVQRVRLAQQASAHIVRTLTPAESVLRLEGRSNEQVIEEARRLGDGLYVVGLDYHVGLLRLDGASARFCHSSNLGARLVVCEDATTSPGMGSTLHVVGDALTDTRILDWLRQRPIPTHRPGRPGAGRASPHG